MNNYWHDNSGHAFEIGDGGYVLAEGNAFQDVTTPVEDPVDGSLFISPDASTNADCKSYLGRACELNSMGNSGTFSQSDEGLLSKFKGQNIASADASSNVPSSAVKNAGQGHL